MIERERLIKLLEVDMSGFDGDYYEELADYLLSHGVIVPPVKVGDTVWYIPVDEGKTYIEKFFVEAIEIKKLGKLELYVLDSDDEYWWVDDLDHIYSTCEEAEKALEKMK